MEGTDSQGTSIKDYADENKRLAKLETMHCLIEDKEEAKMILRHVNYYRLMVYFRIFLNPEGNFVPGFTFMKGYRLYEFDMRLSVEIFGITGTIEISYKTRIADRHAKIYGPLGYLDAKNFNSKHDHAKMIKIMKMEIRHRRNSKMVRHHMEKYGGKFPLWAISELFTLGMTTKFYYDMLTSDKKAVAGKNLNYKDVFSWLKCLTDIRNMCAHRDKLYGHIFRATPRSIKVDRSAERSLWETMLCLKELYPFPDKWNNEVLPNLESLFNVYSDVVDLAYIHFPADWANQLKKKG